MARRSVRQRRVVADRDGFPEPGESPRTQLLSQDQQVLVPELIDHDEHDQRWRRPRGALAAVGGGTLLGGSAGGGEERNRAEAAMDDASADLHHAASSTRRPPCTHTDCSKDGRSS
jgi:hypothetical protein